MKVTYINHSGFYLENNSSKIIIDYYKDENNIIYKDFFNTDKQIYVLVSHQHSDHFNSKIFSWIKYNKNIKYILSFDVLADSTDKNIFFLKPYEKFDDGQLSIESFGSTDEGISFLINSENKCFFHAGDLNNWHWKQEATPKEAQEYEDNYLVELEKIFIECKNVDLLMFPIDPRLELDIDLGARQFIEKINVKNFIPMHFWGKYDTANKFYEYCEKKNVNFFKIEKEGSSFEF